MNLKVLLLTLSLILAGFTHLAFGFYGVDLGKLKVIEDSSKNQDRDYNDVQYKVNPTVLWQNINSAPVGGSGGIFYNQPRVTNPFWKNTNTINPNPFGGIFEDIQGSSNNQNKDYNNSVIRYQRDKYGNKINIKSNSPSPYIDERDISMNTKATEGIKLEFFNGEWREYQEVKSNHTKEDAKGQSESDAIAKRKEKERVENERIAAERIRQAESDKIAKQKELDKQRAEEEYQARIAQEESLSEIDKDDKDDSDENISINNPVSYLPQGTNERLGKLQNANDSSVGSITNNTPKTLDLIHSEDLMDLLPPGYRKKGPLPNGSRSRGGSSPNSGGSMANSPDQGLINPGRSNPNSGTVNPNRETGGEAKTNNVGKADNKQPMLNPLIQFINENSYQGYAVSEIPNWRPGSNSDNEPVINPISPDPVPGTTGSSNGTPNSLRDFTNFGNKNGINPLIEGFAPEIQKPSTSPGNEESPLKTNQLDQLTNDKIVYEAVTKVDFDGSSITGNADAAEEAERKRKEEEERKRKEEEERKQKEAEEEGARLAAENDRLLAEAMAKAQQGRGWEDNGSGGSDNGTPPSSTRQGDGTPPSGTRQGDGTPPSGTGQGNGSDPNVLGLSDSYGGSTSGTGGSGNDSNNSRENIMDRLKKADPSQQRAIYDWETSLIKLGVVDLEGQWIDFNGARRVARDIQNLAKQAELPKDDKSYITAEEFGLRVDAELQEEENIKALGPDGRAIYRAVKEIEFIYGKGRVRRINTEIQRRNEVETIRGTDPGELYLTEKKINAVIASINRNTPQEQSKNERSNSPSVRGDWSQGSYEERQIAKLYQKKKTNKKSSSDGDKSDNDSDD